MTEKSSNMPRKGYKFKLLHEEVATQDAFKYGTHENVADAIYRFILNEDKSATIGLEGGWGSGKSTVVHLVSEKLKKDETLVYTFDAWAHEGDPLRRIFLEGFIDTVLESPSNRLSRDNKKWLKERSDLIQARKKTTHIKTNHHTTKYATWLSLSALLVPAGAAFLSQVKYDQVSFSSGISHWLLWFGVAFTLAPLIVTSFWWLGCKIKCFNKKANLSLFTSGSEQDVTQNITEDGERTSIEFEKHFKDISEKILQSNSFKRVVIVIDNLDRIEREDARKVWSTLQTFFQYRSDISNQQNCCKNIWFVVPYDQDGLSGLWSQNISNKGNGAHVANSFLDKCFQVRFEVPAPVMSSWQDFFVVNAEASLTEWPKEDKQSIIKVYQICHSRLEDSPTPREIRNFINQVGITGSMWGGEVSAESIALYCHLRYKDGEAMLRKKLLKGIKIPDGIFIENSNQNITAELAGLLFCVEKEAGMELLLHNPIRQALEKGKSHEIETLYQKFGEAFKIAWNAGKDELIPKESSDDQQLLINFTQAFIPLSQKKDFCNDTGNLEKIWRTSTTSKWDLSKFDYASTFDKLKDIFSKNFSDWVYEQTEHHIKKVLTQFIDVSFKGNDVGASIKQIKKLETFLKEVNKALKPIQYKELDPTHWTQWLNSCEETSKLPNCILPAENTITAMSNSISRSSNTIEPQVGVNLLKTYKFFQDSKEWEAVSKKLEYWMGIQQRNCDDTIYELALLLLASSVETISNPIKAAVCNQFFWNSAQTQKLAGSRLYTIPTLVLLAHGEKVQSNQFIPQTSKLFWTQSVLTEDHNKSFSFLCKNKKLECLWAAAKDEKNVAIIEIIGKNLEKDIWSIIPPLEFMNQEFFDVKKNSIHKKIAEKYLQEFSAEVLLKSVEEKHEYDFGFWELTKSETKEALELANQLCESLTPDDWDISFENNNYFIDIAIFKGVNFHRHHFSESFTKFIIHNMTVKCLANEWIWDNFEQILCHVQDRKKIAEDIVTSYISNQGDVATDRAFNAIKTLQFSKRDIAIENNIDNKISKWLDDKNDDRLEWAIDKFNFVASEDEVSENLTSRLKKAKSDEKNPCYSFATKLISQLKNESLEEENLNVDSLEFGKEKE